MTDQETRPAADRDLLRAFADRADHAAFAELVRRHGGLVLGVCQRVLAGPDADDAFQATFLVLARKAGSVRRPEALGNWLYGVAVRCARRAKARAAKRQAREQPVTEWPAREAEADWRDVRPVLDEELARLPDKLRAAVVLCELEGVPRPEAAARLGVPEGTLSSRLARAKEALRRRLVKRGIALSAVGVGMALANAARAAVPPGLAEATAAAAAGNAVGAALTLAQAEVTAMFWAKALKVGLAAAVLAVAGVGAAVGYERAVAATEADKSDKDKIQGEWKVTSIKIGGHEPDDKDHILKSPWVFKGDKLTFEPFEADFKLDPSKDPKQIDVTIQKGPDGEKGLMALGIYKLDGDKLTIHACHPGDGDRPTDFETTGGRNVLVTLERVRK